MSLFVYAEEAPFTNGAPTTMRLFRSDDNGVTWNTEPSDVTDATSLFDSHPLARNGQVYVGQTTQSAGINGFTPTGVIARTLDGGFTWAGVVPATEFPGDPNADSQWNVREFLDFDNGTILALGQYTDDAFNTFFGLLRSTDDGATFLAHKDASYTVTTTNVASCRISAGVGLVAAQSGGIAQPVKILKTTDSGATWTQIATCPYLGVGGANAPHDMIRLSNGRLILAGEYGGVFRQPAIWTSDDGGVTWAGNSAPVPGLNLFQSHLGLSLAAPSDDRVVLTISGNRDAEPGFTPFWLSDDQGGTFDIAGSYNTAHSQLGIWSPLSSCVADDGSVVVAYTGPGSFFTSVTYEAWRGVISAGPSIAWTKTLEVEFLSLSSACGHTYIVNAGVLGSAPLLGAGLARTVLDCGTPIGPNPCPQECD